MLEALSKWANSTRAPASEGVSQGSLCAQLETVLQEAKRRKHSDAALAQNLKSLLKKWQQNKNKPPETRESTRQVVQTQQQDRPTDRQDWWSSWDDSWQDWGQYDGWGQYSSYNWYQNWWADSEQSASRQVRQTPAAVVAPRSPAAASAPKAKLTGVLASEWSVPPVLVSKATVEKCLAENKTIPGNLVELTTANEVQEMFDLYQALEVKHPISLITGNEVPKPHTGIDVKFTTKRRDGSNRRESWTLWKLGNIWTAPSVKPAISFDSKKYQGPNRVTIRVTAPEQYRRQFLEATEWDSVSKVLASLASWKVVAQASVLAGGQWQWQQAKHLEQLVGFLRVNQNDAEALTKLSGKHGIFVTTTPVSHQTEKVKWITREEGEDRDNYLLRCQTIAKSRDQGLKYRSGNGNNLGTLRKSEDPTEYHAQTCRVNGVPATWDAEQVLQFLQGQEWQEVDLLHRRPAGRKTSSWLVRAFPPKDQPEGPWSYVDPDNDYMEIYVAKQSPRVLSMQDSCWLQAPKVKLRNQKKADKVAKPEAKPLRPRSKPPTEDEDQEQETRNTSRSPRRRAAAIPPTPTQP